MVDILQWFSVLVTQTKSLEGKGVDIQLQRGSNDQVDKVGSWWYFPKNKKNKPLIQ